jgi:hypothetical protein
MLKDVDLVNLEAGEPFLNNKIKDKSTRQKKA